MERIIELVEDLDPGKVYEELSHPGSGGICVFFGAVREATKKRKVSHLFFESYENMAIKEMNRIADEVAEKWNLNKVIIKHAVGNKKVQEPVVIVGASSAHRDSSFEACRYLIDTLKEKVPIWKKEFFDDDEVWVSAHP
ncbi:molybdenum cofactor biosynthesis protein MoaE [Gramella jeungdoensis]|uniref:Molybdopterin synthase catalytic subunit n=1 Tax=Gramella jeungdoensis TaxID=708091 RepID=A0ABT0Z3A8_9FLAO|nr:molybdenum cofactor biosynthesis protein MoaE [Gramella jeungdoensis]MCM8569264.1 molybdenum cofactor biosynthesis protein MoaE [Gramella jeungdoensis]